MKENKYLWKFRVSIWIVWMGERGLASQTVDFLLKKRQCLEGREGVYIWWSLTVTQPEDNWLLVRNDSLAEICFYIHCIDSMNRYDLYFIYISYTPQFISYIHFIWIVCIFCINRIFCFHRIVREKIASQASHVSRQLERKTFVQNSSNLIWQPPIFCRTS